MTAAELILASDSVEAVILPDRGGRLHRLRAFGHDLLRTPPDLAAYDREPFFWGSFVMAPWCNRIGTQPTRVGARTVRVPPNFVDGFALHGQAFDRPWSVVSPDTITLRSGGDTWPWKYEVSQRIVVVESVVRLEHRLVNRSADAMPAGIGVHPWFQGPVQVAIRGELVHDSNLDSSAEPVPVHSQYDLRQRAEAAPDLDGAWTALADPPVELLWPTFGLEATIRTTPAVPYVVAASPHQYGGIAIEPQTHAPHGLRRLLNGEPGALAMLGPGEVLSLDIEFAFGRVG